jgi:hypothetical protein
VEVTGDMSQHLPTSYDIAWSPVMTSTSRKQKLIYSCLTNVSPRFDDAKTIAIITIPDELLQPKGKAPLKLPTVVKEVEDHSSDTEKQLLHLARLIVAKNWKDAGESVEITKGDDMYTWRLVKKGKEWSCPFGFWHDSSNAGILNLSGPRATYRCFSPSCKDFRPLEFHDAGLLTFQRIRHSTPQRFPFSYLPTHKSLTGGSTPLLERVREYFMDVVNLLGLVSGEPVPGDRIDEVRELVDIWIKDTHAVINHFIVRISDADCAYAVFFKYVYNSATHKKVKKGCMEFEASHLWKKFEDDHVYLPVLEEKEKSRKRKKTPDEKEEEEEKQVWIWRLQKVTLPAYYNGRGPYIMPRIEKVSYSETEWFPALGDADDRPEAVKEDKLNLFTGLDIPPSDCVEWYQSLAGDEKVKADEGLIHLQWLHLEVLCGGDKLFNDYALRYAAVKYFKPQRKMDAHIVFSGPQGIGKSLIYSGLYHQLFGPDHSLVVNKIEELTSPTFNAHLTKKLVITCEEVNGTNSFKVMNELKAILDSRTLTLIKEKYKTDRVAELYHSVWFISDEKNILTLSDVEHRYKVVRGKGGKKVDKYASGHGFRDAADFYLYIKRMDPRILGYLLTQQNIEDFQPHTSAPRTVETVKQILDSFEKLDLVKHFWHRVLLNEVHVDLKNARTSLQSLQSSTWIQEKVEIENALAEGIWRFQPSTVQLVDIQRILAESVGKDTAEVKQLCEQITTQPTVDLVELKAALIEYAPKHVPSFLSLSIPQKTFYSDHFQPFFESSKKRNPFSKPSKIPNNQEFWTNAIGAFFTKKVANVTRDSGLGKPRRVTFTSLEAARASFAKRVLRKADMYEQLFLLKEIEY